MPLARIFSSVMLNMVNFNEELPALITKIFSSGMGVLSGMDVVTFLELKGLSAGSFCHLSKGLLLSGDRRHGACRTGSLVANRQASQQVAKRQRSGFILANKIRVV